ncbi:DNA mismatch repair protein MutS [Komagataeibacter intermedius]|uniref:DNA mismatch repair protein MutS n=1 Tax=Komagataeibacter intermedius TaxID=66229 RepID=UPI003B42B9E2
MTESTPNSPMVRAYRALKEKNQGYIVLFRVGEFYEILDADSRTVGRVLGLQLTRRRQKESDDVPMCGIPAGSLDVMAGRLLAQGYRLAICEQPTELGAERPVHRLTPGTCVALEVLDAGSSNNLMVALSDELSVSFAWIDISTGEAATATASLSGCAAVIARAMPTEILVARWPDGSPALATAIRNAGVAMQDLSLLSDAERTDDASLAATFGEGYRDILRGMSNRELQAMRVLLTYIARTFGRFPVPAGPPRRDADGDIMQIDGFTLRGLEVFVSSAGREGALVSVLDRTVTAPGRRLLTRQLSAPQANVRRIRQQLDMVRYFVDHPQVRSECRDILSRLPDILRAAGRLSLRQGNPRDLANIRDGLSICLDLLRCIESANEALSIVNRELGLANSGELKDLVQRLRRALLQDPAASPNEGEVIAYRYSSELDAKRQLRDKSREAIDALKLQYIQQYGVRSLKIRANSVIGYHVEVPVGAAPRLDPSIFRLRQGLASSTRYTTDELDRQAQLEEETVQAIIRTEEKLYRELVEAVLDVRNTIGRVAQAAAALDLVAGFAQAAAEGLWVEPEVHEGVDLAIEQGRHPVAERLLEERGRCFQPNDCVMGSRTRMWVITGPNMAGKSTFLRQTALIILMAQVGSFVPARRARIGLVDRMYSRIGAGDDLAAGKSTFMVEMQETATILQEASERSFVILDEIGRGTATSDGVAIAQATMEYLHDVVMCRTLLATHYHELADLADISNGGVSMMMDASSGSSEEAFSYRMTPGRAGNSYGLRVARMAGVPEPVVQRAEQLLIERSRL